MDDDTPKRLKKAINWLIFNDKGDSDKEIAAMIGYTKSSFSQIVNGRVPLSGKFVKRLCVLDPNLNYDWIMTGDGEMFIDSSDHSKQPQSATAVGCMPSIDTKSPTQIVIGAESAGLDVVKLIETLAGQQEAVTKIITDQQRMQSEMLALLNKLTDKLT